MDGLLQRRVGAVCLSLIFAAACGIDTSGLGPATGDDGGGSDGSGGPDVGSSQDGTSSGGPDGTSSSSGGSGSGGGSGSSGGVSDAALDGKHVDGCVPTGPERCTNGVDDDCNGLVDCQDPACTSAHYACVADPASAGSGWDFAPFDATGRPGCPASLTQADDDVNPTDLTSPATCTCTCSVSAPPNCEGQITATFGMGNCNMTWSPGGSANNGACTPVSLTVDANISASTTPTGGTCTGATTVGKPGDGDTHGELCSGETAFGAGCNTGQVCALVPTGFQACVRNMAAGATCPSLGYTTASAVGHIVDNRGCTACGCGAPTSSGCSGTWSFYGNQQCTGAPALSFGVNGTCGGTGGDGKTAYQAYQYISNAAGVSCGAPTAAPMPNGSITLTNAQTVCCD